MRLNIDHLGIHPVHRRDLCAFGRLSMLRNIAAK